MTNPDEISQIIADALDDLPDEARERALTMMGELRDEIQCADCARSIANSLLTNRISERQ